MNLQGRQIETKTLDGKFATAASTLRTNPYEVITCRQSRDGEPDAILLAPTLYRMLMDKANGYDALIATPEFSAYRHENRKLKAQVDALLKELGQRMGEGEEVSPECWQTITESVYEAVDETERLWEVG